VCVGRGGTSTLALGATGRPLGGIFHHVGMSLSGQPVWKLSQALAKPVAPLLALV
jgi:hypothetical protein